MIDFDFLLGIEGMPNFMVTTTSVYVPVTTPEGSPKRLSLKGGYDFFYNLNFLKENSIHTLGDLLDWLNRVGYGEDLNNIVGGWVYYKDNVWKLRNPMLASQDIISAEVALGNSSFLLFEKEEEEEPQTFYFHGVSSPSGTMASILLKYSSSPVQVSGRGDMLNDYRYVPEQYVFYKDHNSSSKTYFGIEIEFSTKLSPKELHLICTEVEPKQTPFFYIKHDGSVSGRYSNLFELVTHPGHPRALKHEFRTFFKKIEMLAHRKGMDVGDVIDLTPNENNGLHIHVDKRAFALGKKGRIDKLSLNKFAILWNLWDTPNNTFIQKLSKRLADRATSRYFRPHSEMKDKTLSYRLRNGAECSSYSSRYASARYTKSTVEVRVFQGQWNLDHIFYCIDMVQAVEAYSKQTSFSNLGKFHTDFRDWLFKQPGFREAKKGLL